MSVGLPRSLGLSAAAHALALLLAATLGQFLAPRVVAITEISLVTGPGAGPAPAGPAVAPVRGGRKGTARVRTVKRATRGSVVVATPEFVPLGKKPRRSGEELMGSGPGEGGASGPTAGTGPAVGGSGRKVRYAEPIEYPDWAREQGLDAKVVVRFRIFPNGAVDPNVFVTKTSGWKQIDELVIKAIRQYQFEPLAADQPQVTQTFTMPVGFHAE